MVKHLAEGSHWAMRNMEPGLRRKIGTWVEVMVTFTNVILFRCLARWPYFLRSYSVTSLTLILCCGHNAKTLLNDLKLWCHCPISDFDCKSLSPLTLLKGHSS